MLVWNCLKRVWNYKTTVKHFGKFSFPHTRIWNFIKFGPFGKWLINLWQNIRLQTILMKFQHYSARHRNNNHFATVFSPFHTQFRWYFCVIIFYGLRKNVKMRKRKELSIWTNLLINLSLYCHICCAVSTSRCEINLFILSMWMNKFCLRVFSRIVHDDKRANEWRPNEKFVNSVWSFELTMSNVDKCGQMRLQALD